jgi:hypothetical protein
MALKQCIREHLVLTCAVIVAVVLFAIAFTLIGEGHARAQGNDKAIPLPSVGEPLWCPHAGDKAVKVTRGKIAPSGQRIWEFHGMKGVEQPKKVRVEFDSIAQVAPLPNVGEDVVLFLDCSFQSQEDSSGQNLWSHRGAMQVLEPEGQTHLNTDRFTFFVGALRVTVSRDMDLYDWLQRYQDTQVVVGLVREPKSFHRQASKMVIPKDSLVTRGK